MSTKKPLWKTTIVVWSPYDPEDSEVSLEDLGRDAMSGESVCSRLETIMVDDPESDPEFKCHEFFDMPGEEDEA